MALRLVQVGSLVAGLLGLVGACTALLGDDFEIVSGEGGSAGQGGDGATAGAGGGGGAGGEGAGQPGCGDGELQPGELCLDESVVLGAGFVTAQLAAARLDDDLRTDLVALDVAGSIRAYMGSSDGSMQTKTPNDRGVDGAATLFALGDLDSDGTLDIVLVEEDTLIEAGAGDGAGAFSEFGTTTPPYTDFQTPALGNFDESAVFLDLAIDSEAALHIGYADGVPDFPPEPFNGWFDWPAQDAQIAGFGARSAGDFDGDNHDDVVDIFLIFGFPQVDFHLGDGSGAFTIETRQLAQGAVVGKLIAAQVDAPGTADDVILHLQDRLRVYLGGATIGNGLDTEIGADAVDFAVGDIDGDGTLDAVACTIEGGGELQLLMGDGTGQFTAAAALPAPGCMLVAVGDFNGDGLGDVAVADGEGISLRVFDP